MKAEDIRQALLDFSMTDKLRTDILGELWDTAYEQGKINQLESKKGEK